MNDNSQKLRKVSLIEEVERVPLSNGLLQKLGVERARTARSNVRNTFAYRIVYRSNGHRVVGYLLEPREGRKLPCIIWNRGGSGDFGKHQPEYLYSYTMGSYARAGYILIMSQYSGNGGSEGKDEIGGSELDDVLALRTILKEYSRADEQRIGMFGESRGGMMTFMALRRVKWIKAAALRAPMSDVFSYISYRGGKRKLAHYSTFFTPTKKALRERSAAYWVKELPKKTPLLIMHGTADWRVQAKDSIALSAKLLAAKVPHRLMLFEGADHALSEVRAEEVAQVLAWFDRFVKNREVLPNLRFHGK